MHNEYSAEHIQVLKGLDAVRKRPGMYIGSTGPDGLHHLVYEVVDNSVDEAMAGFCTAITVSIEMGNVIRVVDNGRGIPVEEHPTEKVSALEIVMTKLHAGGKFDKNTYKVSGGLHGVGVSVVNALSEWCEVEVHRDGEVYLQRYERGIPVEPAKPIGITTKTGTVTRFLADDQIFETTNYSFDVLTRRLRELAFLNKGIQILIEDERPPQHRVKKFQFEGGIAEFISFLNKNKTPLQSEPIYFSAERESVIVEVALEYNEGYNETMFTYVNNINTREGGTHLVGFRSALTRSLNEQLKKSKLARKIEENLTGDDVREGLTAVISVKVPEPQFEGQTKARLGNSEVKGIVESVTNEHLSGTSRSTPAKWTRCSTRRSLRRRPVRRRGRQRSSPGGKASSRARGFPESLQIVPRRIRRSARSTSSKVTVPAAAPSRAETVSFRRSCRSGENS